MSQYLKDAVVRAISQALASYVEGITAEQAQLNIRDGRLDLPHARLRHGVVPPTAPLKLKTGNIGLSIRIPWLHLGDEPVVVNVSTLVVELEPEGRPSSAEECQELVCRWRQARGAAVAAKAHALAATDDSSHNSNASFFARLTKQILQNLEVRIEASKIALHDVEDVLELHSSVVLQTADGASGQQRQHVPTPSPAASSSQGGMFFKCFEVNDVAVHLNRTSRWSPPLLGPLSLRTKLSDAGAEVKVQIELLNNVFKGSLAQLPKLIGMVGRLSRTVKERAQVFPKRSRQLRNRKETSASTRLNQSFSNESSAGSGAAGSSMFVDTAHGEETIHTFEADGDTDDDEAGISPMAGLSEDSDGGDEEEDDVEDEAEEEAELDAQETEYTELLLQRLQGVSLEADQSSRLQEIEDSAPIAWLAWRLRACEKQLEVERRHDCYRAQWFLSWRHRQSMRAPQGADDSDAQKRLMLQGIRSLLRELPEDEAPQTISVSLYVPTLDLLLRDEYSSAASLGSVTGDLVALARGLVVDVRAKPQGEHRNVSLSAGLVSAHLKFADEPLINFDVAAAQDQARGASEHGETDEFFDIPGAAVELTLTAWENSGGWVVKTDLLAPPGEFGVGAARDGSFNSPFGTSIDSWPFEIHLAPWSIRRFLELYFAGAKAYGGRRRPAARLTRSPTRTPARTRTRSQAQTPSGRRMPPTLQDLEAVRESFPTMKFSLNLRVAAPALHWTLPTGDFMSFRLGQLYARSVDAAELVNLEEDSSRLLQGPHMGAIPDLALAADLTQMCVTIFHNEPNKRLQSRRSAMRTRHVYRMVEPSTISACLYKQHDALQASLRATFVRMRGGEDVWRFFGQLQPTLDWALEPLSQTMSDMSRKESRHMHRNSSDQFHMSPRPPNVHPKIDFKTDRAGSGQSKASAEFDLDGGPDSAVMYSSETSHKRSPSHGMPGKVSAEEFNSDDEAVRHFLGIGEAKKAEVEGAVSDSPTKEAKAEQESARRFPPTAKLPQVRIPTEDCPAESSGETLNDTPKAPRLLVRARLDTFEILWGDTREGACLELRQLSMLSMQRKGPTVKAEVASMEFRVRNGDAEMPLLSLHERGTVAGGTGGAERPPWVRVESPTIYVRWRPQFAAPIIRVVRDTRTAWVDGQVHVRDQLSIPKSDRGTIAETWQRWRETRLKGLRKRINKRLRKLKSQFPDPSRDWRQLGARLQEEEDVEHRLPSVAGEGTSLQADVCLKSLSVSCWPEAAGGNTSRCIGMELGEVTISARLLQSGTIRGRVALQGFEVHLYSRRVLAPRILGAPPPQQRPAPQRSSEGEGLDRTGQLLEIGFHVGERTLIVANGAQLSLVYRQRDVAFLLAYLHAHALDVIADLRGMEPPQRRDERDRATPAAKNETTVSAPNMPVLYSLNIGCPVLFVPTFKAVLADRLSGSAYDVSTGGHIGPSGNLEDIDEDTYTMVDFGILHVWNRTLRESGLPSSAIELRFQGPEVKSSATGRLRCLARPTDGTGTEMTITKNGRLVKARSKGNYCMELLRGEVTQWLDIVAENVLWRRYAPVQPSSWPSSSRQVERNQRLQQVAREASTKIQSHGFIIEWCWQALHVNTAFTETAPLSHIELCRGKAALHAVPFKIDVQAGSLVLLDRRPGSRNAERAFIRCSTEAVEGGAAGAPPSGNRRTSTSDLELAPTFSVSYSQGRATVNIIQPVTIILPQLFLDQQMWGLSVWRNCTWRRYLPITAPQPNSPTLQPARVPARTNGVEIVVQVEQGAFRVLTEFEDRNAEHLEIRGHLAVRVGLQEGFTELRVDLRDGRIHRSLSTTLLCPTVSLEMTGGIRSERSDGGKVRTKFGFKLDVRPLKMQLTGLDLGILTRGFAELGRRDAESVEPREEVELRDPDALRENPESGMDLQGDFVFQRLELLLADNRRGSHPAVCATVRCRRMPTAEDPDHRGSMHLELHSRKGRASTWKLGFEQESLVLEVRSFHPQLGAWEPVISDWRLSMAYEQDVDAQQGHEALRRHLTIGCETELTAIITTTFIKLISWFVPLFAAHLHRTDPDESGFESSLGMLNLSGAPCTVSTGSAMRIDVWPGPGTTSLDALLRPGGSAGNSGNASPMAAFVSAADASGNSEHEGAGALEDSRKGIEIQADGFADLRMQLLRESVGHAPRLGPSGEEVEDMPGLVCEVLVPHPSRRLLLLSSAVRVENCTQLGLELRFLDQKGEGAVNLANATPVNVSAVRQRMKPAMANQRPTAANEMMSEWRTAVQLAEISVTDRWSAGSRKAGSLQPGQLVFAPFNAIHGKTSRPRVKLQLRPQGPDYAWSGPAVVDGGDVGATSSIILHSDAVQGHRQTFYLDVQRSEHEGVTTLQLAVWTQTIANATPCTLEFRTRGSGKDGNTLPVNRYSECPILGDGAELQLRLRIADHGSFTEWSSWLSLEGKEDGQSEEFSVTSQQRPVWLVLHRDPARRRVVIFAPLWFVDATGLGAQLSLAGCPAVRFGDGIHLPPIKPGTGANEVELALEGQQPAKARIPVLEAMELVTLPPHRELVLRTERISVAGTFGMPCGLVSLLPRYALFNETRASDVVFRQEGMRDEKRLKPGERTLFFFAAAERKRLAFAPMQPSAPLVWSPSFELADHSIGAYPIATSMGPLCLRLSREGGVFSATIGEAGCHELRNEHKSLIVEARPDGDLEAAVVALPGDTRPFASLNPFQRGTTVVLHLTRLGGHCQAGLVGSSAPRSERVQIDVRRRDRLELRVGGLPITVIVATIKRVAVVTVRPRAWHEAIVERFDISIKLRSVAIALVGDRPRCERFGFRLDGLDLAVGHEKGEDMRTMSLKIKQLQVDRLHPRPDVLIASVRGDFLSGTILREDCNSSHVLLSSGQLSLGELEAAIDDTTVAEIRKLIDEAVQEPPGLQLAGIHRRAEVPYPRSCQGPPELPPTFVLRSLQVSQARIRVWARLSLLSSFLPRSVVWITWLTRITGLGVSILQLDGAVFSLPQLRFFQYASLFGRADQPFSGSVRGLLAHLAERYIPELAKCWHSVVSNSNVVFGGVLSRQFWFPRNRKVSKTRGPLCRINKGQVEVA